MLIKNGWITSVTHCPSPNFNARPVGLQVSLLVVHGISLPPGKFDTGCVEQFFQNTLDHSAHPYFEHIRGIEVSSHLFIDRAGHIVQFVSLDERAWHAGQSHFDGVSDCNNYSIGVELEGTDTVAYTSAQYASLAKLTKALLIYCPAITYERIVGHSDIAPGRKTDPGPSFNWHTYRALIETP